VRKVISCSSIAFLLILAAGCGGSGSGSAGGPTPTPLPTATPTPVSVNVSPASGSVQVARTLQLIATVTGTSNQGVTWAVNGTAGGNSSSGTVSSSGLYSAPTSVPNPGTVTVSATSVADSTKSGSAGVQIVPPPSPAGTWSRIAPFGGIISNLTVDPRARNVVYAAAFNSGVFKSADTGQTWAAVLSPTQSSVSTNQPSSIAVGSVSSTLYFVTGTPPNAMSLFTSTDGGISVSKRTIPAGIPGPRIETDPKNDNVIYICGQGGIKKSTDGGSTWTNLATAPSSVNAVRVDLQNSSLIYAGATTGFYKSTDSGTTWTLSSTGIDPALTDIADIRLDPVNPARIFVSTNTTPGIPTAPTGHVYITTNAGSSWTETTAGGNGWLFQTVGRLQLNANTLYASVSPFNSGGPALSPVLKSTDGGTSWSAASSGIPSPPGIGSLLLANTAPDVLLFGTTGPFSLLRSADGATSWAPSATGISGFTGQQVRLDPSLALTLYFAAANNGGLWKSTDLGTTWTNVLSDSIFAVAVDPNNALHLLAANFQQFLLQSTDGGTTWQQVSTPFGIIQSIEFSTSQTGLVLACSPNGGIARSTDNGNTWSASNTGLQTTACRKITFDSASGIIAATPSGVYKSSDGGSTWTLKKTASDTFGFFTAAVDPTNPLVIFAAGANFYIKSSDGGNTWSTLTPGFIASASPAIAIDRLAHNTVYVSSFAGNAAVSTDGGLTWAPVTNGLGFAQVQDLLVIPGTSKLFAATFNNGLLEFN
jgi:photosystem II stability/assembly factor-like uncharacterized protein